MIRKLDGQAGSATIAFACSAAPDWLALQLLADKVVERREHLPGERVVYPQGERGVRGERMRTCWTS